MILTSKAGARLAVLQPAWGVLTEILKERRAMLYESLRSHEADSHDYYVGRLDEVDETLRILDNLETEAKNEHS